MQAKIVFRGNKCFREFDLKTVAEKLGLSIDDFNHFALAVDINTTSRGRCALCVSITYFRA